MQKVHLQIYVTKTLQIQKVGNKRRGRGWYAKGIILLNDKDMDIDLLYTLPGKKN